MVSDPAAAQSPGRITGLILDGASGNPVEGAVVVLNPLDRQVFTNDAGVFILRDLPEGTYTIRVSHLSFEDHTTSVRVASGETTQIEIVLDRKPIATDTLNVRVERKPAYLERMGYYRRLERGWGTFLGPAWVESRNRGFTRADQFVRYVKAQSPALGCDQTPVYLDGRRIRNEPAGGRGARNNNDLLAEMSSNGIGAVEVYASGNGVPIFALNDTTLVCGAVVMWSKRWTDEQEVPQIEVVLCQAVGTGGGITLDGVVRDELTRVVLPGARVTLVESSASGESPPRMTIADRLGRFRYCDLLPQGPMTVTAEYGEEAGEPLALATAGQGQRELSLVVPVTRPGEVAGRVIEKGTGRSVAGADIALEGTDLKGRTNERGEFRIREVPPGDYVLVLRHVRYGETRRAVTIDSGRSVEVRVQLTRR